MIVGTRVRVKSWPQIKETLINSGFFEEAGVHKKHKRMMFAEKMKQYCNVNTRITRIKSVRDTTFIKPTRTDGYNVYDLADCDDWLWHEDWIYDLSITKNNFPDEVFEI